MSSPGIDSGRRDSNPQQPAWKAGSGSLRPLPRMLNMPQHGCSRNVEMQRICSASRHCLATCGNVWQESGGGRDRTGGVAQALDGARIGAQVKGPAAVAVGPWSKAGDEI